MALINNSSITKRVIDGLGINTATDKSPTTTDEIKPVFVANDNGKLKYAVRSVSTNVISYTVPSNMYWKIESLTVRYSSDATVGNRVLRVQVNDPTSAASLMDIFFSNQPASQGWTYALIPMHITTLDTSSRISPFMSIIPPSYRIEIFDNATISASDYMKIILVYREFNLEA